jgi:hypothetical protein
MPRVRCAVCNHPQRTEIDKALALGTAPQRTIGASYGIEQSALSRHRTKCIKTAVAKALETRELITGTSLISTELEIQSLVHQSAHQAASQGNHSALAPLANAYHKGTETIAKLAGIEGFRQPQAVTNVAVDARGSQFALVLPFSQVVDSKPVAALVDPDVIDV